MPDANYLLTVSGGLIPRCLILSTYGVVIRLGVRGLAVYWPLVRADYKT
jgi:hypothetical protein